MNNNAIVNVNLHVTCQRGFPERGILIFNVHVRNRELEHEWDISYTYYQFSRLDYYLATRVESFRNVHFPHLDFDSIVQLAGTGAEGDGHPRENQKLMDRAKLVLENWVHEVITKSPSFPIDARAIAQDFFYLPNGIPPMSSNLDFLYTPLSGTGAFPIRMSSPSSSRGGSTTGSVNSDSTHKTSRSAGDVVEFVDDIKEKKKFGLKSASKAFSKMLRKVRGKHNNSSSSDSLSTLESKLTNLGGNPGELIDPIGLENDIYSNIDKTFLTLLKIRVQRGGVDVVRGFVEYEIQIVFNTSQRPYRVIDRYDAFRQLRDDLGIEGTNSANSGFSTMAKFPPKSFSLFGATEEELSERARMLDAWLREVCCYYKFMGDRNRGTLRTFFCFDMSNDLEIYLQDKLMNGQVEAPRAEMFAPPSGEKGGASIPPPTEVFTPERLKIKAKHDVGPPVGLMKSTSVNGSSRHDKITSLEAGLPISFPTELNGSRPRTDSDATSATTKNKKWRLFGSNGLKNREKNLESGRDSIKDSCAKDDSDITQCAVNGNGNSSALLVGIISRTSPLVPYYKPPLFFNLPPNIHLTNRSYCEYSHYSL